MQFLYVCSRPITDNDGKSHRHLLGILSYKNGEYQFRYLLGDDDGNNGLLLPVFPDKHKIYNDHDARLLLDDYLPSENNTTYIKSILQKIGLNEYNEWEWLKAFEPTDENAETKLYENLPEDIIVHENIDGLFDNNNTDVETDTDIDETIDEESDFETAEDFENNDIDNDNSADIDDLFPIDEQDNDFPFDDDDDIAYALNDVITDDIFENQEPVQETAQEQIAEKIVETKSEPKLEPLKPNTVRIITRQVVRRVKRKRKINDLPPSDVNITTILEQRLQKNIEQRQKNLKKLKEE